MANNRMYIRCKRCGDAFFIGKTFGYSYYYDSQVNLEKGLNEFYSKHAHCKKSREKYENKIKMIETKLCDRTEHLHNENLFEICYEIDWSISDNNQESNTKPNKGQVKITTINLKDGTTREEIVNYGEHN